MKGQNHPMIVISNDDSTQQSQNSSDEKTKQELKYSKIGKDSKSASILCKTPKTAVEQNISQGHQRNNFQNNKDLLKGKNQPKDLSLASLPIISSTIRNGEVSCEVSNSNVTSEVSCEVLNSNMTNVEENSSVAAPEINPSTISTTTSGDTTMNEIIGIVEEISSRIRYITLTNERLDRITKYFAKSKIFTSYESEALEWIADNMQTIYSDPTNACKKLRIAIGNACIPIDFAKRALWLFVKNHAICTTDMIKYCSDERRKEVTINELSQILKRLIKLNIKRTLSNDSDSSLTIPLRNSSLT